MYEILGVFLRATRGHPSNICVFVSYPSTPLYLSQHLKVILSYFSTPRQISEQISRPLIYFNFMGCFWVPLEVAIVWFLTTRESLFVQFKVTFLHI